jgi:hypothetical protein
VRKPEAAHEPAIKKDHHRRFFLKRLPEEVNIFILLLPDFRRKF